MLSTIDQILTAAALAFVVGVGVWWASGPRQDPLCGAPPRPNQLREDAVALAMLIYLGAAVVISGLTELAGGQADSTLMTMVVGNGAHLAGIGACLVIAAGRFQGGVRRFCIGEGGPRIRSWIAVTMLLTTVGLGLCPMVRDATMSAILHFAPDQEFMPHPTIESLHDESQPIVVVVALWAGAVAVAPVAEELFFRGLLQTLLVRVVRSRWLAIGLASVAFGAVHFPQPHAVAALILLGILIGYAYERTGSLLPPIVIHAAFNLKTLIWEALSG